MKALIQEDQKPLVPGLIQDFIEKTDWDAFWKRVYEKVAPEMDAYARARAISLNTLHVFL